MASSTVRIICPNLKCRAILSIPSSARGKTVRCRQCGMRVTVPPASPAPSGQERQDSNTASPRG